MIHTLSPSSIKLLKPGMVIGSNSPSGHTRKFRKLESKFRVLDVLPTTIKHYGSSVNEDTTLDSVIEQLVSNFENFVVVHNKHGLPIGAIHLFDIVTLCCNNYAKWMNGYQFCYRSKVEFAERTVKDIIQQKQFHTISIISPLSDLIKHLTLPTVNEVAVLGDDQEVLALVTRSDVTAFLNSRSKELPPEILKKQVQYCNVNPNVNPNMSKLEFTIEAFHTLWGKQKSGFWVSHGTSTTDKFLNLMLQIMLIESPSSSCSTGHCVNVYEEDTLKKVLEWIQHRCVQRVYVTDRMTNKTIGDIAVSDILAEFQLFV